MAFDADSDLARDVKCLKHSKRLPLVRPGRMRRPTLPRSDYDARR